MMHVIGALRAIRSYLLFGPIGAGSMREAMLPEGVKRGLAILYALASKE